MTAGAPVPPGLPPGRSVNPGDPAADARSRTQVLRDRLVLLRDGGPGSGGNRQPAFLLDVALHAWSECGQAMLDMNLPFIAGFLVMVEAGELAGSARSRAADLLARTRGGDVAFYNAEPGTVFLIGLMLLAAAFAASWVQTMLMRVVLRRAAGQEMTWQSALWPDDGFPALLATITLPQLCAVMPFFFIAVALAALNHWMGGTSAALSVPLLVAPAIAACVGAVRASLAGAPAAQGLAEPIAESWAITRGRVGLLCGTFVIGLGPCAVLILAWPALLQPAGFGIWQALWTAAIAVPAFGVQGGITALLYERWRTALRPDMRPSRHHSRRREPLLT